MTLLRHTIDVTLSPVPLTEVARWRDWLGGYDGAWAAPWKYKGTLVLLGVRIAVEARHGEFAAALDALDAQGRRCPP